MRYFLINYFIYFFLAALPSCCPYRLWQLIVRLYLLVLNSNVTNGVLDDISKDVVIKILDKVVRENA